MFRARWRIWSRPPLAPPLIVMGTAALIFLCGVQLASAAPLRFQLAAAPDCQAPRAAARAAGRHLGAAPHVTQNLAPSGEIVGRTISGTAAGKTYAIALPVESAVSSPDGDALLYTRAAAGKSEVHLVDLATGCDALLMRPAGTARSAVLDPRANSVYVHSVSFPARTDLGVARYALDGSGSQSVVGPLPDDARFGLTFGTQLGWSTDGATLFVQSCAQTACRTRLLDVASDTVATFDGDDQGQIIGLTPVHLITYAACDGLPCPIISVDRSSGATATLTSEAWSAAMDGVSVQFETAAGTVEIAQ